MKNEKEDRRVQRTRQLLTNAMMELIPQKGYDSITVQDIIDRANLGRSTFYSHYQDKQDLFISSMEKIVHNLIWGFEESPKEVGEHSDSRLILSTKSIFQHAQEQHTLHKGMIGGRGIDLLIKGIQNYLSSHVQKQIKHLLPDRKKPKVPSIIIANYLASALLTILIWWLENDMPYSPEEMDEMFQELTMPGFWAVLGET